MPSFRPRDRLNFSLHFNEISVINGNALGCLLSFLVGRVLFKYWATFFTKNFKMMAILTRTISRNSWKIMFLLRLSPVMPYNVLNYSLSLVENITILSYTVTAALGKQFSLFLFLAGKFFWSEIFFSKSLVSDPIFFVFDFVEKFLGKS